MKNYRELQNCLNQSLEGINSERTRSEKLFNDLLRYLVAQQGIPKKCVFFADLRDPLNPVVSLGAQGFVVVGEDRAWTCSLVFRVHEKGPRGRHTHSVINPKIVFRDEKILFGIDGVDLPDIEVDAPPEGTPTSPAVERFADLATEAAAIQVLKVGGAEDRKISFTLD